MSQITLTVLNRTITLNCQDGDEKKITAVAERLQHRMRHLKQGLQASDLETLIIGSIVILDELETAHAKYDTLKAHMEQQAEHPTAMPIRTAEHLENIVNTLEQLVQNASESV